MRRRIVIGLLVLAVAAVSVGILAWPKKVEVKSGSRVVCTYGETLSEDIKTFKVSPREAANYGVRTETITCKRHKEAEKLYGEAQTALSSGDTKKAKKALDRLVAIDPSYAGGKARSQLDEISQGKKPSTDNDPPKVSPPSKDDPGGGGAVTTPAALVDYVPNSLVGYRAEKLHSDGVSVSRTYVPSSGSEPAFVTVVAEQFADGDSAKKQLQTLMTQYPEANTAVKVEGRQGRFGVRDRFSVIVLTDGSITVAVEAASSKDKPAALQGELSEVLKDILR